VYTTFSENGLVSTKTLLVAKPSSFVEEYDGTSTNIGTLAARSLVVKSESGVFTRPSSLPWRSSQRPLIKVLEFLETKNFIAVARSVPHKAHTELTECNFHFKVKQACASRGRQTPISGPQQDREGPHYSKVLKSTHYEAQPRRIEYDAVIRTLVVLVPRPRLCRTPQTKSFRSGGHFRNPIAFPVLFASAFSGGSGSRHDLVEARPDPQGAIN
jgi:hypothetical protein